MLSDSTRNHMSHALRDGSGSFFAHVLPMICGISEIVWRKLGSVCKIVLQTKTVCPILCVWQVSHTTRPSSHRTNPMQYPLTPVQKRIVKESNHTWNGGDDNDFSCLLSNIMHDHFVAGNPDRAWSCFQNDPMAIDGVSYDQFCKSMKTSVARRREIEKTSEAHDRMMGSAS